MSILLTILGLSLLIVLHELGHFGVARLCGMRVLRFSVGFGPVLLSTTLGETRWQIAAIPLGGFVQIDGMGVVDEPDSTPDPRSFRARPMWQRLLVIFAGPAANWLLAAALIAIASFTVGFDRLNENSTVIGQVLETGPAAKAGLTPGDRIIAVDGASVTSWPELVRAIETHPETPVMFRIQRGETLVESQVTPERSGTVGKIGVGPQPETVRLPAHEAWLAGLNAAAGMTANQARLLWRVVAGREEGKLSGLPGIVDMVSQEAQRGARRLFGALAWLSIGLFLLNLLPIPALDGGRLLFLGIETARGRPINHRLEATIHAVGFALLFALMIYVSVRDLL